STAPANELLTIPRIRYRSDLKPEVAGRFRVLLQALSNPPTRSKIYSEVLSPKEQELAADAEVAKLTDPGPALKFGRILQVFAWTRGMSAECALLEIAKAIGAVRDSEYRSLRRAIGEPVEAAPQPRPMWDENTGELRLNGLVIRHVPARA